MQQVVRRQSELEHPTDTVDSPVSVSGPIGGAGDAPLEVDTSSCDVAWGDWSPAVKESSAAAGNVTTGTWNVTSTLTSRTRPLARTYCPFFH